MKKPTVQRIADLMEMDQSALSRGLVPLEREGLVTSAPDEKDKRKKVLRLTPEGDQKLVQAAEDWKKAQDEVERQQAKISGDIKRLMAGINDLASAEADE